MNAHFATAMLLTVGVVSTAQGQTPVTPHQNAATHPDSYLAAFARKTLPALHQHVQLAGELPGGMHAAEGDVIPKLR